MNKIVKALAASLFFLGASVPEPVLAQETIKLGGKKIVGGEPANIADYPWQVAIDIKGAAGTYLCGGSIIAQKWILTAAHCFEPSHPANAIKVKAGVTNYVDQGVWTQVEKIVRHENYNAKTDENDIALVKLKTAPSGGRVIPLAAATTAIPANQPLEVTGWGDTKEDGQTSKQLLKATVPLVDNATCNAPASYNGDIRANMMCAGKKEGGVDSCQGDSGGPLVWKRPDGAILVGVVSFGDGCARKLKYGVYTKVSAYLDWIQKVRAEN